MSRKKSQISWDFQRQIHDTADFPEKLAKFSGQILLKTIVKTSDFLTQKRPQFWHFILENAAFFISLTTRFFLTKITISFCSFNNNALKKCTNGKAFYIMATVSSLNTW